MSGSQTEQPAAVFGLDSVRLGLARNELRRRIFGDEPEPLKIGRFAVLCELGRGGMGIVYSAYDAELDRRVALKVLQRGVATAARGRMQREAQAMAKLRHPNVVQVYEVGQFEDALYIAMELVEGCTLLEWQNAQARGWREVVAAYVQAGQGLAAAHAAGLVHRDFKPHNAIVETGSGGLVVRVLDFGLARLGSHAQRPVLAGSLASSSLAVDTPLTITGTLIGTPAYMAPEQIEGGKIDAAADQFSFCVALWEALDGERPFAGSTIEEVFAAVDAGNRRSMAKGDIPRHVVAALERGLRPAPDERWPNLDVLLAELTSDPARRRRRWLGVGAGAALLVAGGALLRGLADGEERACNDAATHVEGIWDDVKREEVRAAVLDTGLPFAQKTWTRTREQLDGWVEAWLSMHEDACRATTVRGDQSPRVMDLRMACLRRGRQELEAAVAVLLEAEAGTVARAHEIVGALPSIARCGDVETLEAGPSSPDPGEAAAVEAVRSALALSRARLQAGQYEAALHIVDRVWPDLESIAFAPVHAEASIERGEALEKLGRLDEAEHALRAARQAAARAQQWGLVRTATAKLMWVLGARQTRHAEALALQELVEGLSESPSDRAQLHSYVGEIRRGQQKLTEAEAEHRAAIRLWEEATDARPETTARAHNNLALDLSLQGRHAEADAEQTLALRLLEEALGPDHPDVAAARTNHGESLRVQGKYDEAELEHRAAIDSFIAVVGAMHVDVARARVNLANTLYGQGKYAEAEVEHRAVVAVLDKALGEHVAVAGARNNLASTLFAQEKMDEAEEQIRVALRLKEKLLGREHPDVARSRDNLGSLLRSQGRLDEAEPEIRAALEARRKALPPSDRELAFSYTNLGALLEARRDHAGAEVQYRAALEVISANVGADHPDAAKARTNVANMSFEQGRLDDAEKEHRIALADKERGLPPDHPEVADSRLKLGLVLLRRGAQAEAVPLLEAAWDGHRRGESPPSAAAEAGFVLAQALWSTPAERRRAFELAEQAAELYRTGDASDPEALLEIERWLDQH